MTLESPAAAAATDAWSPVGSLTRTARTAERMVWGVGKVLLTVGETVNDAADVVLNFVLGMLKAGGATYDSMTARLRQVPVLGVGVTGINEAIKTTLDVMDSDVRHGVDNRKRAFDTLNRKMAASGSRLSSSAATSAAAAAPPNTVTFPQV